MLLVFFLFPFVQSHAVASVGCCCGCFCCCSVSALIVFILGVQRRSSLEKSGCNGWGKGTASIITFSS